MRDGIDAQVLVDVALGAAAARKGPALDIADDDFLDVCCVRTRLGRLAAVAEAAVAAEIFLDATVAVLAAADVDGAFRAGDGSVRAALGARLALGRALGAAVVGLVEAADARLAVAAGFVGAG